MEYPKPIESRNGTWFPNTLKYSNYSLNYYYILGYYYIENTVDVGSRRY